jgi:hypothetical protein
MIDVMKQALIELCNQCDAHYSREIPNGLTQTITALRQAIKEYEEAKQVTESKAESVSEGEPYCWLLATCEPIGTAPVSFKYQPQWDFTFPLYTHPTKSWRGLSDVEIAELADEESIGGIQGYGVFPFQFYKRIENKLKELNK